MAQIIEFQTMRSRLQPRPPMVAAKKCCDRCGADQWHIHEDGEIFCADCEEACSLQLQIKNEH